MRVITDVLISYYVSKNTTHTHTRISGGFVIKFVQSARGWLVHGKKREKHVAVLWELVVAKSDPTLLLIENIFPNGKEEDKVDKSKSGSNSKDNKEGVFVVHGPEIFSVTSPGKNCFIFEFYSIDLCSFRRCCCLTCKTKRVETPHSFHKTVCWFLYFAMLQCLSAQHIESCLFKMLSLLLFLNTAYSSPSEKNYEMSVGGFTCIDQQEAGGHHPSPSPPPDPRTGPS